MANLSTRTKKRKMTSDDFEYLIGTQLLQAAPEEARSQVLACLAHTYVQAGERFIRQGEEADCLYLIQEGSCLVSVDRDEVGNAVARRKAGEIVGEMSILIGEKRTAHVDAETEMKMWRMSRVEFEELCLAYPNIREFVTDLVTKRISESEFTPHRAVGKYVITDVIDQGGWGIVYKGLHETLKLPVAIKMMKHVMAMDGDFTKKFEHEAHLVARLNHPNIVRVYDIEYLYRTIFIVMEYLCGMTVREMLARQPRLLFPRLLNLLIQVAEGLAYAHREGIVHQDIKPENLFVREDDRVKIVDFGLACPAGTEDNLGLAGTPYYMAPEQIDGDPVDERTDIYSFGITAFEMATGRRPFAEPGLIEILKAHKEIPMPDPRSLHPDLPPDFAGFVQRATQKDPDQRYGKIEHALEHLNHIARQSGVETAPEQGEERKMTSLLLAYSEHDQVEVSNIVEEFSKRLRLQGVDVSVANYSSETKRTARRPLISS